MGPAGPMGPWMGASWRSARARSVPYHPAWRLRIAITMWRHTRLDLIKLVVLSTSVLVLVIAIGAAVKPLSDGALQPQDLPKFLMIACVPMLAYALPFAAGFAATLVYYRVAHENEAVAAH